MPMPRHPAVTAGAPHVRDTMSVSRAMTWVVVALIPCLFMALFNTGYQANLAMTQLGVATAPGWHGVVLDALATGYDPAEPWANLCHGAMFYLPVLAVSWIVAAFWQYVFATLRRRGCAPGIAVVALLFSLSLPPTVPLWQVALGMSFGIVVAREVFGGFGMNFLNPALTGLAFLYATYPRQMVGETAWTVIEGFTGATTMRLAAEGGMAAVNWAGTNWMQAFLGGVPGAFGATSTLACLIGAAVLIATRTASVRVMAGALGGMIAAALAFNQLVGASLPFAELSWPWHLVLGSFAFGVVFLATDPVTAAQTDTGRWICGIMIGALVVVIRVANVAHPDGVMFAILLANITAPLIDYLVVRANVRRRARRHG